MKPNNFRKPRTGEKELQVQYRNGIIDGTPRKAADMRWTDTGHDFDIVAVGYWEKG